MNTQQQPRTFKANSLRSRFFALCGFAMLVACLAAWGSVSGQQAYATEDTQAEAVSVGTDRGTQTDAGMTYKVQAKSEAKAEKSADADASAKLPVVTVDAPEGALPEGAELHAELVESEDDTQAVADELEKAEVSYDGFLALDVFFTDADGNEVEPSEPVDVRFELPEGTLPEGAEDLAVHHLAEAEDGTVSEVEAVADDADATEGTVAVQDDATVDAEFTVESFSWFTLTYNGGNDIQVNLVTEDGSELPGDEVDFSDLSGTYSPTDFGKKYITDQWVSIEKLAETWASKTEGYEFVGAYANQNQGDEFKWIRYNTTGSQRNQGWRYSTQSNKPNSYTSGYSLTSIYLVYREISDPDQTAVKITDNVSASGKLTASYDGAGEVFYVWEKSSNGTDGWQTIEQLKLNGDQYLYDDADQHALNVALEVVNDVNDDGGSWYRVSAYASEDAYKSGEVALATSAATQLDYYDELQNGNFELPDVEELTAGDKSNYQYPVGTEDLVWKTTGSDQQVEIVNENGSTHDNDYKNSQGAQNGKQYAELNCQAAGALYQDVLTVPGTSLNWQLYHRGRNGSDTMYLVIAPTDGVDDITTQTQLNGLIDKIKENQSGYRESDGYYLLEITDNNNSWHGYASGSNDRPAYEVPSGQYMTRFFFVAGNTASEDPTVGNLLDNVQFTTGLLPAEEGEANLTIKKVVSGASEDAMEGYSVEVDVDGLKVTLDRFSPQQGGTYSATKTVTVGNIPGNGSKRVTVTENANTPGGYTAAGSTVSVNSGQAQTGTSAQVTLQERGSGNVTFTNTYTPPTPPTPEDVSVGNGKSAVLDEETGNYTLNLSVTGNGSTDTNKRKLDILFILDESASMDDGLGSGSSGTRMSLLKTAVNNLVDSVSNNSKGIDAEFAAVSFSSSQNTKSTNAWVNASQVKSFVADLDPEDGTNYQQGIHDGTSLLNNAREDAATYVIFVSDGIPTYRGVNVINSPFGDWDGTGNGSNDNSGENIAAAVNEIKGMTCDAFYAIGMGPDFGAGKTGTENLESLANAVSATSKGDSNVFNANDTSSLQNAFSQIAADITSLGVKDVTMIDVLSQWADLVPGSDGQYTFSFQLAKANEDGSYTNEGNPAKFTLNKGDSATQKITVGDETIDVTISLSQDAKTIMVDFPTDYQLDPAYRYTVSTTITPSPEALDAGMSSNEAQQTPDENTGTHADAGEQGFWSNDNDQSVVKYKPVRTDNGTEVVGDEAEKPFPKPVIQVNTAEVSGALEVVKHLEGDELTKGKFDVKITAVKPDAVNTEEDSRSPEAAEFAWGEDNHDPRTQWTIGNGQEANAPVDLFHTGSDLTFDAGDVGKEYAYIYEEVEGTDNNYTYDKAAWKVVVSVERNEDSELVPYAQVYKDADGKDENDEYEWTPCDSSLKPVEDEGADAAKIELVTSSDGTPAITIQFNNKVSKADLKIKKVVAGPDGMTIPDAKFTVRVELKDEDGNPITNDFIVEGIDNMTTTNFDEDGAWEFEISADQTVTIKDLPVGAKYKVTEPESTIPGGFQRLWIDKTPVLDNKVEGRAANKPEYEGEIGLEDNSVTVANSFIGYGLEIYKGVAKDGNGSIIADPENPLPGAQFTVYQVPDGTEMNVNSICTDGNIYQKMQGDTEADGYVTFGPFTTGTYYFKETRVPSGYQMMKKVVQMVVSIEDGQPVAKFTRYTIQDGTGDLIKDGDAKTKSLEMSHDKSFGKVFKFDVANKPNPDLPQSGSSGTLIMSSVGVATIILAGVYLLNRRFPLSK